MRKYLYDEETGDDDLTLMMLTSFSIPSCLQLIDQEIDQKGKEGRRRQ